LSFKAGGTSIADNRLEPPLPDRIGSRSRQPKISLHTTQSLDSSIPAYKKVEYHRPLHVMCLGLVRVFGLDTVDDKIEGRSLWNDDGS
jgi:hypothetical protein